MKFIERREDVITGSSNLEDLDSIPNFPIFMGAVEHPEAQDIYGEMSWSISRDSGVIQLKKLVPLDLLYQSQTTTSAVGATWMEHHKAFAKYIDECKPKSVLEIGGAHGVLSKEYLIYEKEISWTILEPNPSPVDGCEATFIRGYFDDNFQMECSFDTLVHSHVLEHIYEPNSFMNQLARFLKKGQKMIFSVPNMEEWLKRKYTNCINFEHTIFLTESYVDFLLSKYGFRVLEKKYYGDGHSIFYKTIKDENSVQTSLKDNLYEKNKKIYKDYVHYYQEMVENINIKLENYSSNVYLFGAHIFSQYLIIAGLNINKINNILDNDKNKSDKRLYGTSLLIKRPEILRNIECPIVILKAGPYNEEIKKDIMDNINNKTVFIE